MSHGTLEYAFTECLYKRGNHEAGELNGIVLVSYNRDGAWSVDEISLDDWDCVARKFNSRFSVPKDSEVYRLLLERLTNGRTAGFIQSEVSEKIEEDRADLPNQYADYRRKMEAV